jgi:hypothetical protein
MKPFLSFCCAASIFVVFLFSSCKKEYSDESGNVPVNNTDTTTAAAVFTYSDSAGICAAALFNGTYKKGVASTAANTVTIKVSVSVKGKYAVSTETVNGIVFSASGTFNTAGANTMVLYANGTPLNAGTFTYGPKPNGCFFSVTVTEENNNTNTAAVFTFPAAPNECDDVKVNGIYTAGDSLNAADSVMGIKVDVTVPGTYYLTTVPNNGISFTGSGSFTKTGLQTVTLFGSGTPVTPGQFNYSPGNNGCFFVVTVTPANPVAVNFIKCKIDGVQYVFSDAALFTETVLPANPPAPAAAVLEISGNVSGNADENFLLSLTKTGTSFSANEIFDSPAIINGKLYVVTYNDAAGASWNAISGIALTPFTITISAKTATRVQGTFSGTLSDTGMAGGNIKTVTDGTFSVPIQ